MNTEFFNKKKIVYKKKMFKLRSGFIWPLKKSLGMENLKLLENNFKLQPKTQGIRKGKRKIDPNKENK